MKRGKFSLACDQTSPCKAGDLVTVQARIVKMGRRLAVLEVLAVESHKFPTGKELYALRKELRIKLGFKSKPA